MRFFVLTALLLSTASFAQVSTRALIWGGGATPDAAATALKNFNDTTEAKELFEFIAGYPKIVESASIAGLKPGFHVVLLGVCGADESQLALAAFKSLQPHVYARPVQITERNCPKLKPEWKAETKGTAPFSATGLIGPYGRWKILFALTDAAGEIIDFKAVNDSDCMRGSDLHSWYADATGGSVGYTCMQAGCTSPDELEMSVTVTVVKKRLKVKSEEGAYRKGVCD